MTAVQVLLDGEDVRYLNTGWLRRQIGVVSQEPILFATTIGQNITYGCEGASQDQVEQAARQANAHDFISKLPDVSGLLPIRSSWAHPFLNRTKLCSRYGCSQV